MRPTYVAASVSIYTLNYTVQSLAGTFEARRGYYNHKFLLSIRNRCRSLDLSVLSRLGGFDLLCQTTLGATTTLLEATPIRTYYCWRCVRTRKRGRRGGVIARLKANSHKPVLPIVMLATVSSLDRSMD